MKSVCKILFIMSIIAICFNNSIAQNKGTGLGIIIGEPTGLSAKLWKSNTTAYDAGLAWSFGNKGNIHLHADHLWHNFKMFSNQRLPLYYGLGVRANLGDDTRIGVRGVLGVNYFFTDIPIDAFLEIVPIFDVIPGTGFSLNAGIGLRYFF